MELDEYRIESEPELESSDRKIIFSGKHIINAIDKKLNKKVTLRESTKNLDDDDFSHVVQIKMINEMFLSQSCRNEKLLRREIEKKISGYKAQDIDKQFYDAELLISLSDTIEKLVESKLKCHYCNCEVLLLYKNVRDPFQWSLDRIDNSKCHSRENTIIACLKCNLQRRTQNMNKFLFTKQLKITKQD